MTYKRIALVAGTRPNFTKIAPLVRALAGRPELFSYRLIHTGQHFDREMNDVFFEELGIPPPDAELHCGSGTHAETTARVMIALESELLSHPVDSVLVVGDVNSTLAAALVAKKLQLELVHVEAGLRSGDRTMPEEINRIATDAIADVLFVTEPAGVEALQREGHRSDCIHLVGNVMIDNLFYQAARLRKGASQAQRLLGDRAFGVVTLHRPSNVDVASTLHGIVDALRSIAEQLPLLFPMHPRTRSRCEAAGVEFGPNIHILPPLSYMEFLAVWKDAEIVLTDSGGLQEETTALGVRCVTLRHNTERPVTITHGTNRLAGTDSEAIVAAVTRSLAAPPSSRRPPLWDGRAAERIAAVMAKPVSFSDSRPAQQTGNRC